MTIAITVGILTAGAVYLLMQREMVRIVLGFILLSHGVNLLIVSTGGTSRRVAPFQGEVDVALSADPLPQAMATDIRQMKARVDKERVPTGEDRDFHLKLGPGALVEIEFLVQLMQLASGGRVRMVMPFSLWGRHDHRA